MKRLELDIHFLTGRYHGSEWPPAPMRLLQAIVAGCHSTDNSALRWLESRNPPIILAQADPQGRPLRTYVPANNLKDMEAKAPKSFLERRVASAVSYVYELLQDSDAVFADQVRTLAESVHTLGTGLDAAHVIGRIERGPLITGAGSLRWVPWLHHLTPSNSSLLRSPVEGSLASIEAVFQFKLQRNLYGKDNTPHVPNAPPTRYAVTAYAPDEAARGFVWLPLSLYADSKLKSRWAGYAEDTVLVAGMLRHALMSRADEFGVSDLLKDFVAGHPKDNIDTRVSYLPLPSIGHHHIDGLIRRALLVAPAQHADWVEQWIAMMEEPLPLVAEGLDKPIAFAAMTGEVDSVFDQYLGTGQEWVTVTPMVLPGDYSRGWTLVRKLIRKALREAGFATEEVEGVTPSKVPMIAGAKHAHVYRRKVNPGKSYSYHARVQFSRPVAGPIWIGRQRHQGLGVLAQASAREM
jgi:CRISPR-associated protein Csb2